MTPQEYRREWYLKNRERVLASQKTWREANKELKAARDKAYREANKATLNAKKSEYNKRYPRRKEVYTKSRQENIEAYREREAAYRAQNREACNERIRQWKQANPHKLTHYFHKRRAALLKAMPVWANLEAIEAIYADAQRIQAETGVPQHVDHIVPILSKLVCGLHCEANLRIIPARDNERKNNRHWPDMP